LIEPFGHWEGSAGSSVTFKGVSRVGTSGACNKAFCGQQVSQVGRHRSNLVLQQTITAAGCARLASIWKTGSGSVGS